MKILAMGGEWTVAQQKVAEKKLMGSIQLLTLLLKVGELLKERGNVDDDTGTNNGGTVLVDETYHAQGAREK